MGGYKILLTGGTGFLGKRILEELLSDESPLPIEEVRVLYPEKLPDPSSPKIVPIKGDIRDEEILELACQNIDGVIHAAAVVDWGTKKPSEVFDVNFTGTERLLKACETNGVKAFVYTSSLDAVYTGKPLRDVDEGIPYPSRFVNMYCESKSRAEQLVLEKSGSHLKACSLRPADIWGEADPYHLEALIDMAKKGFYTRLGNGKSRCQHVYVGNCAYAHVLALKALMEERSIVFGQAYFITDSPAENFFKFFDQIVRRSGYAIWPKNFWIPKRAAYLIGSLSEVVAAILRPIKYYNPKFSRFAVQYTCTDFTFTSDKAGNDFDFKPKYQLEEAMKRTAEFYKKGSG